MRRLHQYPSYGDRTARIELVCSRTVLDRYDPSSLSRWDKCFSRRPRCARLDTVCRSTRKSTDRPRSAKQIAGTSCQNFRGSERQKSLSRNVRKNQRCETRTKALPGKQRQKKRDANRTEEIARSSRKNRSGSPRKETSPGSMCQYLQGQTWQKNTLVYRRTLCRNRCPQKSVVGSTPRGARSCLTSPTPWTRRPSSDWRSLSSTPDLTPQSNSQMALGRRRNSHRRHQRRS